MNFNFQASTQEREREKKMRELMESLMLWRCLDFVEIIFKSPNAEFIHTNHQRNAIEKERERFVSVETGQNQIQFGPLTLPFHFNLKRLTFMLTPSN